MPFYAYFLLTRPTAGWGDYFKCMQPCKNVSPLTAVSLVFLTHPAPSVPLIKERFTALQEDSDQASHDRRGCYLSVHTVYAYMTYTCGEFYLFIDQINSLKLKEASKWTVAENGEGCPMKAKHRCGGLFLNVLGIRPSLQILSRQNYC